MKADFLRQVPLFASLPPGELDFLAASLETREFPAQAVLLQEGLSDDHCYVILAGEVEIIKALGTGDERFLGRHSSGAILGEMSLFSQGRSHTASVRACTLLKALEITHTDIESLIKRQPNFAYEMVGLISKRLEASENLTIQDLREKNCQLRQAYDELKAAQAQIIEKERLERDLEIARQIQLSILPHRLPAHPCYDFGARMVPARVVGGDFYGFIWLDDSRLGLWVGDVAGKSVPGALGMTMTCSLVQAEAHRASSSGATLQAVNRLLLELDVTRFFVTLLYGVLDCSTGEFSYARAGHPIPIVLDERGLPVEVPTGLGQALGLFEDVRLDEQRLTLPPGGMLLVYTDGLSEAVDAQERDFSLELLQAAISTAWPAGAQAVCDRAWQTVQAFTGALPQQDDFLILAIGRPIQKISISAARLRDKHRIVLA